MSAEENASLLVIGLMSGTSMDGIDAALVKTDGKSLQPLHHSTSNYRSQTRKQILQAYDDPEAFLEQNSLVNSLNIAIAQDHANAVQQLLSKTIEPVQLIGFHGQTVLHKPEQGITVQLGCAKTLAQITGINTVHDFRRADIEKGGQGAPLAPVYHQSLIRQSKLDLPAAMLNIGGVANLTYWDGLNLVGFDTGPGNGLLDQYMQAQLQQPYDKNGALAAEGSIDHALLNSILSDDYFDGLTPKSLDRASFNRILDSAAMRALSPSDAMATLAAFTVCTIKRAIEQFDSPPKQLVICGGGQHNQHLINEIRAALGNGTPLCVTVQTADAMQMAGDFIEAELMGLLAARWQYNLPSTFPGTTGVSSPCVAGKYQSVN